MKSKMYASLEEAMQKWIGKWIDKPEYQNLNFHCPENLELRMAQAAQNVFDMAVEASVEAEEQAQS